jgi:hypothetical protein
LADLANRGLLLADPTPTVGKTEEFYTGSSSFKQLMDRARAVMEEETAADETASG